MLFLDTLGPGVRFNHYGTSNYQTYFGVLFSLAALVLSAVSIKDNIKDVFERTSPDLSITSDLTEAITKIDKDSFKVFFRFGQFKEKTKLVWLDIDPVNTNEYIYLAFKSKNNIDFSLKTFLDENNNNITNTPLVSCWNSKTLNNYNDYLYYGVNNTAQSIIDNLKNTALCIPDFFSVDIMSRVNQANDVLSFEIFDNSISNLNRENELLILEMNYLEPEYKFDLFQNPHKLVWKKKQFPIKYAIVNLNGKIKETEIIKDETWFVFKQESKPVIYNIIQSEITEEYSESLNGEDPAIVKEEFSVNPTFSLALAKDLIKSKQVIKYKSISSILADFGGTLDLFNKIFGFVLELMVGPFFTASLLNKAYSFHVNKENDKDIKSYMGRITALKLKELKEAKELNTKSVLFGATSSVKSNIHKINDSINILHNNGNSIDYSNNKSILKKNQVIDVKRKNNLNDKSKLNYNDLDSNRNLNINDNIDKDFRDIKENKENPDETKSENIVKTQKYYPDQLELKLINNNIDNDSFNKPPIKLTKKLI